MKLKEKWAIQDAARIMGYTEQRVYIEGQGDLRWWLSGFNFALKQCGIALHDWEGVGINSFDNIGNEEITTGSQPAEKK